MIKIHNECRECKRSSLKVFGDGSDAHGYLARAEARNKTPPAGAPMARVR